MTESDWKTFYYLTISTPVLELSWDLMQDQGKN